jgi:hypothetical protein
MPSGTGLKCWDPQSSRTPAMLKRRPLRGRTPGVRGRTPGVTGACTRGGSTSGGPTKMDRKSGTQSSTHPATSATTQISRPLQFSNVLPHKRVYNSLVGSGATPGGCARVHPPEKPKTYLHDAPATEPRNDSLTPSPGLGSTDECLD